MRIAILEDEPKDAVLLKNMIKTYCRNNGISEEIEVFETGEALLASAGILPFQLAFLDILMEGLDGIQAAWELKKNSPDSLMVFTTTSPDYAVEGFSLSAVHYLLKPVTEASLSEAMTRCEKLLIQKEEFIEVLANRVKARIRLTDLLYAEVFDKDCFFHTAKGVIKSRISIERLSDQLSEPRFFRCFRSTIVNLEHVVKVSGRDFILDSGELIPIRRKDVLLARQKYADYVFSLRTASGSNRET